MNIPPEAVAEMIRIANNAGLSGQHVKIHWIPPQTASSSPMGAFAVEYRRPGNTESYYR
jgi:hypothetical protein